MEIETKTYPDGTTATGTPPLPDLSPAQQDAARTLPDCRQQVDGIDVLHLLRNPHGHPEELLRRARLHAADEIEAWRKSAGI